MPGADPNSTAKKGTFLASPIGPLMHRRSETGVLLRANHIWCSTHQETEKPSHLSRSRHWATIIYGIGLDQLFHVKFGTAVDVSGLSVLATRPVEFFGTSGPSNSS